MKTMLMRLSFVVTWGVVGFLAAGANAQAQLAKQGKFEIVQTFQITYLDNNKFGDFSLSAIRATGLNFNKSGSGFLQNTSSLCELISIPGQYHVFCVTTDLDGDQIFSHGEMEGGAIGTSGGGRKYTFVGGTGKYKGIQGGFTYKTIYGPKIVDQLVGHIEGSGEYQLP